jgi:hypothetical protein
LIKGDLPRGCQSGGVSAVKSNYLEADSAALEAYRRAHHDGAKHVLALNIAVSVWFCRCPYVDTRWARRRVSLLLDRASQPDAA